MPLCVCVLSSQVFDVQLRPRREHIPTPTPLRLMQAVNAIMKQQDADCTASLTDARLVEPAFHPRFSCVGKTYVYRCVQSQTCASEATRVGS